jgi:cell division septation protein DedD
VKPLAGFTEVKADVDRAAPSESDAGAPLSITPPGLPGPDLQASAAPTQNAEPEVATSVRAEPAASGPSFVVRLASSLSESDAHKTLSQLQKEFPGALHNGSVKRDNLGSYGVFYRVRVGPLSREAADKLCSRLRASGRKCVLAHG